MEEKINYWQQKIAQEHEARQQAEDMALSTNKKLKEMQELMKKNIAYKNYLESKNSELTHENQELKTKFEKVFAMLKQAKDLIILRKNELIKLRQENSKLRQTLDQKSELLTLEMMQNEELNRKLARALNSYARHIDAPIITAREDEDDDFKQQLRYIRQQHLENKDSQV